MCRTFSLSLSLSLSLSTAGGKFGGQVCRKQGRGGWKGGKCKKIGGDNAKIVCVNGMLQRE
jgi:hypothetical protein